MSTTHSTRFRTDSDRLEARGVLVLAAYAAGVFATVAVATAAAAGLAGLTTGLGGFLLVAGGWLALVGASPAVGERVALRLGRGDIARVPRTSKTVTAAASLLTR